MTLLEKEYIETLCRLAKRGETKPVEVSYWQFASIFSMLDETKLSKTTKDVFKEQFGTNSIRADVLAKIILDELEIETGK